MMRGRGVTYLAILNADIANVSPSAGDVALLDIVLAVAFLHVEQLFEGGVVEMALVVDGVEQPGLPFGDHDLDAVAHIELSPIGCPALPLCESQLPCCLAILVGHGDGGDHHVLAGGCGGSWAPPILLTHHQLTLRQHTQCLHPPPPLLLFQQHQQ